MIVIEYGKWGCNVFGITGMAFKSADMGFKIQEVLFEELRLEGIQDQCSGSRLKSRDLFPEVWFYVDAALYAAVDTVGGGDDE